jgi:catechol 2,3-dioxygenase-like lactoylglutathione lyase family enzyme
VFDQFVTFLYTRDLERSAAFYGELLGLPLVLDQGGCRIFRVARDAFIGICRCSEARPCSPGGVIVTLVSDDVGLRDAAARQSQVQDLSLLPARSGRLPDRDPALRQ